MTSTSAATAAGTANKTALGYGEASVVLGAGGGTFFNQTVDGTAVLVRYTYAGDATLDGTVNLADFNKLAGNFGLAGKFWTDGDFTYDGSVNLADFNLLAGNFGLTAAAGGPTSADWAALAAAVPEPATVTVLPILALLARGRYRKSGQSL